LQQDFKALWIIQTLPNNKDHCEIDDLTLVEQSHVSEYVCEKESEVKCFYNCNDFNDWLVYIDISSSVRCSGIMSCIFVW
jgi:hypothetical protein